MNASIKQQQYPLANHNAAKTHDYRFYMLRFCGQKKSNSAQKLKHGQQEHITQAVGKGGAFCAQFRQAFLLPAGDRHQHHLYTADVDHILRLQCADADSLAVDTNASGGICVGNGPAAVIITGQNAVMSGNCWEINNHITFLMTANDILPMGDGDFFAVFHHQPCPNLRFFPEGQQRTEAAQQ